MPSITYNLITGQALGSGTHPLKIFKLKNVTRQIPLKAHDEFVHVNVFDAVAPNNGFKSKSLIEPDI